MVDSIMDPALLGEAPPTDEEPTPHRPSRSGRRTKALLEFGALVVVAIVVIVGVRTLLFQAFYIPSESMVPTLNVGDRVLVNKLSYKLHDPRRGDIVVFEAPPSVRRKFEDLVKRIVGLPNDVVEIGNNQVYINGRALEEPYLQPDAVISQWERLPPGCDAATPSASGLVACKVPTDSVFMMGDNRGASSDSRVFGTIKESAIIGRVFARIWPITDFTLF